MSKVISIEKGRKKQQATTAKKIIDLMNEAVDKAPTLDPLFDHFWREGELAMLYGVSGSGKSILAAQIGDALARGRAIDGFAMPTAGRRVLYVDLQHADFQFTARYRDKSGRQYKFSEKFFRIKPPADTKEFVGWLRETVKKGRYEAVIIDDIGSLKTTNEGTRETLAAMRELRRLRDETLVSILVVTDAAEPRGKRATEADLGRSRVLCTVADSAFALSHFSPTDCRIVQTRSRNAAIVWTAEIAPAARITRLKGAFIGFEFDERFIADLTPEENDLVQEMLTMRDTGMTVRQTAEELGISKSRAHRLLKKYFRIQRMRELGEQVIVRRRRAELYGGDEEYYDPNPVVIADTFPGCDQYDKAREDPKFDELEGDESTGENPLAREYFDLGQARIEAMEEYKAKGRTPRLVEVLERMRMRRAYLEAGVSNGLSNADDSGETARPKTIYDLPVNIDRYGKKIYVEKEEHHTRRPQIFYTVNPRSGQILRYVRRGFGIFGTVMKDANLMEE
jgi:DNA replication protein DnaC